MQEHLIYKSDTVESPSRPVQVIREIGYIFLYLFYRLIGTLYRLPDSPEGEKRPVVLVSGILGSSLPWAALRKRLIENGHPVYIFYTGFQLGDLNTKSEKLEKFLLEKDIYSAYLVCHSMGGLIAGSMGYRGRDRIYKAYLLGTPVNGTPVTYFMPVSRAIWQMMPHSKFIKSLRDRIETLSNIQNLFADRDEIVFPREKTRLGRFDDVMIPEFGHMNLIMGPLGRESVSTLIESEESKFPYIRKQPAPEKNEKAEKKQPVESGQAETAGRKKKSKAGKKA